MLDGEAIQRRRVGAVREHGELTASPRLDRIADEFPPLQIDMDRITAAPRRGRPEPAMVCNAEGNSADRRGAGDME